jgi:hypothetical protein
MLCVCGACCDDCPRHGSECAGCEAIEGKVYWVQYIGADVCPVFKCARDKVLNNCGDCSDIPCELWFSLRDPQLSEEEHYKSIEERVSALKG